MILHGGWYYCPESSQKRHILIRRSRSITDITQNPGVCVWTAPARGRNPNNLWAPELHLIDGKWFIYYAADDGNSANRRIWALESEGADPRGKYRCRGELETDAWATDGTVMSLGDGRRYFVWSGRPGHYNAQQNLYLAPMKDPVTLSKPHVLLAAPDQPWERVAMPVCERPQVLRRNGDLFIVYSASGSSTPDCCLGLLRNQTQDVLDPAAWHKLGPVFKKTERAWGVAHCCFVKSLSATEEWVIYRSKPSRRSGREEHDVQARQLSWTSDGLPDFGAPLPRAELRSRAPRPRPAACKPVATPLSPGA